MSNQHPIIKALQEELAKERNDEMTAFEFCTGPVGYRIGHDSATARLLPLLEKAIEVLENLQGHADASLLFPHKDRIDLFKAEQKAREFLNMIKDEVRVK